MATALPLDLHISHRVDLSPSQKQNLPASYGMNFELLRLGTYKTWPRWAPVMPNRLARAGFFYSGIADEVQCFKCNRKIKQWHKGDRPMDKHRTVNAECDFVLGTDASNVPLPRHDEEMEISDAAEGSSSSHGFNRRPLFPSAPLSSVSTSGSSNSSNLIVPQSVFEPEYQYVGNRLEVLLIMLSINVLQCTAKQI